LTRPFFLAALLAVLGVTTACFTTNSNVNGEGHGLPQMSIEFPPVAPAGSTQELKIEVTNPGPGEMDSVFVAFTAVGVPGSGIGEPLVAPAANGRNPAIVSIEPDADDVSDDGVVYRFPGLEVGDSTTIAFSIVVPDTAGPASNSVQVYDGSEPDRAVGMRVRTMVQG
jgi:hypothetical protein